MRIFRCYCYGGVSFSEGGSFSFKIEEEGKVISDQSHKHKGKTTNNRMSMESVVSCLEELKSFGCKSEDHVIVHTNFKVIQEAFTLDWIGKWIANNWKTSDGKKVANIDLWKDLNDYAETHNLNMVHLKKNDPFIRSIKKKARRSASEYGTYVKRQNAGQYRNYSY
jgi:ribonuclease HI